MSTLEAATLWVHVAAGGVALLAGLGALGTAKGGRRHRLAGRVFVGSMAVVVGTVFPLLALEPSAFRVFLALVAVFSGYLSFSGYRALSRERPANGAAPVDWVGVASVAVACLGLGGWGVARILGGDGFGVVLAVFGAVGLAIGGADVRTFLRDAGDSSRRVRHLQRMLAAFIATVSAVSAVNLTPVMGVAAWLWPTVVGTPVIAYLSQKHGAA